MSFLSDAFSNRGLSINGRYVTAARVATVNKDADRPSRKYETLVYLHGNTEPVRLAGDCLQQIQDAAAQVLPAHPGYEALWLYPWGVERHPVIAWRVRDGSHLTPVTPSWDANERWAEAAVRYPDGRITNGELGWDSEAEWQKHAAEQLAAREAAE